MKSVALQGFQILSINKSDYEMIGKKISKYVSHAANESLHYFENPRTAMKYCRPSRDTDLWCQPYFLYDNEVPTLVLDDVIEKSNINIRDAACIYPFFDESQFIEKVTEYDDLRGNREK